MARTPGRPAWRERQKRGGDQTLGHSPGGFGTKVHILADSQGTPLAALLSPGQGHESLFLEPLLKPVRIGRRVRPKSLACDKGHRAARIRAYLRKRGIRAVMPYREDELRRRPGKRGRPA